MRECSILFNVFFFSSRRRHTRYWRDWSSDVCSSDLAAGCSVDVTNVDEVRRMVAQAVDGHGGLHILVNNAGIGIRKRPEEYSVDEFERVIDTNLTAVFVCSQAAYEPMKRGGGGTIVR